MGFEELKLDDVDRLLDEPFEIAQAPGGVARGHLGGAFQLGDRMFFGQLQQTLHDPQPLRAALSPHLLGPSAGLRTEQAAAVQQIVSPAFDDMAFAAVQMHRIGGELARLRLGMQSDLFTAGVVGADQPGFPAYPY
jgi:hypothetical protein